MRRLDRSFVMIRSLIILLTLSQLSAAGESWPRHTIDNSSLGADGVRPADVNGDGLLDLVTPWEEGGIVRVYLHPGKDRVRQPWPRVTVGKVASPEDAVFVDLDADGAMDVVSSCEGATKTMFVHWAPKSPSDYLKEEKWKTEPIPATAGKQAWMFALPKQMNGDRQIDLVVSSKGADGSVGWLELPEDARDLDSWKYHRLIGAGWIMSLLEADMNGDSLSDILLSDRRGEARGIKWLEHSGDAATASRPDWPAHPIGGSDHEVMFIDHADLDDEGEKEVIAATHQGEILILTHHKDREWKATAIAAPFGSHRGKSVCAGDINLDGVVDLVHSTEPNPAPRRPGISWLEGPLMRGKEPAVHPISDLAGSKFDLLQLIDIDRDGDLDVITCEERENLGLIWYENPAR